MPHEERGQNRYLELLITVLVQNQSAPMKGRGEIMLSVGTFINISVVCRTLITEKLNFFKQKFPFLTSSLKGKQS